VLARDYARTSFHWPGPPVDGTPREAPHWRVQQKADLRIENYFQAWSNSVRRDLEALGLLEASRKAIDTLLSIAPADMTDEQLESP
jgi:hypothetical protein